MILKVNKMLVLKEKCLKILILRKFYEIIRKPKIKGIFLMAVPFRGGRGKELVTKKKNNFFWDIFLNLSKNSDCP